MEVGTAAQKVEAASLPPALLSTSPAPTKVSVTSRYGQQQKRCHNFDCSRPDRSRIFYTIGPASRAGGRNWAPLCGMTLCEACYETYRRHGTLKKSKKKGQTLCKESRKCANLECKKPENSREYYQISNGSKAGGQDWSPLIGSVLCEACYEQYRRHGTLKRQKKSSSWLRDGTVEPPKQRAKFCQWSEGTICDQGQGQQSTRMGHGAHTHALHWLPALGSLQQGSSYSSASSLSQFVSESASFPAEILSNSRDFFPTYASGFPHDFAPGADVQQDGCYKSSDDGQGSMTDGGSSQGFSGTDYTNSTSQVFSNRTSPAASNSNAKSSSDFLEKSTSTISATSSATSSQTHLSTAPQSLPQFTGPLSDALLLSIAQIVENNDLGQFIEIMGNTPEERMASETCPVKGSKIAATTPEALHMDQPACKACKSAAATIYRAPCGHQVLCDNCASTCPQIYTLCSDMCPVCGIKSSQPSLLSQLEWEAHRGLVKLVVEIRQLMQ